MLKDIFNALANAARKLFGNWRLLATFMLLDAILLLLLWWFFATGVATLMQVVMTFIVVIVTPVIFLVIQTLCVSYAGGDVSFGSLLKGALRDWWKLLIMGLPVLLLAWLIAYVLSQFGADDEHVSLWAKRSFIAIRFLLLYLALPLILIQLWIVTAREGMKAALKGMVRALAPRAVLTYLLGMICFGVIPYFLFFTKTPAKNEWLEMSLLGVRLVVAFLFIFLGWAVTTGALTILSAETESTADTDKVGWRETISPPQQTSPEGA